MLNKVSKSARALALLTTSVDVVFRAGRGLARKAVHYVQDKPLYDVDIIKEHVNKGEITREILGEHKSITLKELSQIRSAMDVLDNVIIMERKANAKK